MKHFKLLAGIILMLLPLFIVSCGDDDLGGNNSLYSSEICITNKTTDNWHNAGVQFINSKGVNTSYLEIGKVEIQDHVYVPRKDDYFIVNYFDDNGIEHQSEKYYSNPFVDISNGSSVYDERVCITNYSSYDWYNASVHFLNERGTETNIVEIETVEKYNSVYVKKMEDYFIVYFKDNKGIEHHSEKYMSQSYVHVETIAQ